MLDDEGSSVGGPRGARTAWEWARVLLSTACLAAIAYVVDWRLIGQTLRGAPLETMVALLLFAMAQVLAGLRLAIIAGIWASTIPVSLAIRLTFAGSFVSNFLPSTVGGDVLRAFGLRWHGLQWRNALGALIFDRVTNLIALSMLFAAFLALPHELPLASSVEWLSSVSARSMELGWWLVAIAVVMIGVAAVVVLKRRRIFDRFERQATLLQATPVFKNGKSIFLAIGVSAVALLAVIAGQVILARGLQISISLATMGLVVCLVYVTLLLPLTINGLGVQELGIVVLLRSVGAETDQAIAFSVMVRILLVLSTAPGVFGISAIRAAERS